MAVRLRLTRQSPTSVEEVAVSRKVSLLVFTCVAVALALGIQGVAQTAPQTVKGLEISVSAITRGENVSLGDCPPGENSVRGVIRPGDTREFATVTLDVKVLPSFDSSAIVRPPRLTDADGNAYRTAQAFTDAGSPATYSCDFSFRVPKGMGLSTVTIEDATFDVSELE
jgi:hypothetical protein